MGEEYGLPDPEEIFFLRGKTDSEGRVVEEPDWDNLLKRCREWVDGAGAVAVVDVDAMDNSAVLEKRAKQLIWEHCGVTAVCGHELFSDLNSIKRGSSVLLNARLIPLITDFLKSTSAALARRAIAAPVVVMRSDGTLMSAAFAAQRPVETLLCGPAASVMGGLALSAERDSLIVDMGGTTTDVAIVRDGTPTKARDGVKVGRWSTFVRGLSVDTFGLGGDSAVQIR